MYIIILPPLKHHTSRLTNQTLSSFFSIHHRSFSTTLFFKNYSLRLVEYNARKVISQFIQSPVSLFSHHTILALNIPWGMYSINTFYLDVAANRLSPEGVCVLTYVAEDIFRN